MNFFPHVQIDSRFFGGVSKPNSCSTCLISWIRYFCRSLTFDPISKSCVLSSEDSVSLIEQEVTALTGTGYYYFEVLCMGLSKPISLLIYWLYWLYASIVFNFHLKFLAVKLGANEINPLLQRGEGEASPLLVDGRRRDILTAFQRYRNSRLSADFQTEITDRSLAECLDECLRQVSSISQHLPTKSNRINFSSNRQATGAALPCTASDSESVDLAALTKRMDALSTSQIMITTKVFQVKITSLDFRRQSSIRFHCYKMDWGKCWSLKGI